MIKIPLLSESLNEGVSNFPFTVKKAEELKKLFDKPIAAVGATNKLAEVFFDDDLFDRLDAQAEYSKTNKGYYKDVRKTIAERLSELLSEKGFTKKFEEGAEDILKQIIEDWK